MCFLNMEVIYCLYFYLVIWISISLQPPRSSIQNWVETIAQRAKRVSDLSEIEPFELTMNFIDVHKCWINMKSTQHCNRKKKRSVLRNSFEIDWNCMRLPSLSLLNSLTLYLSLCVMAFPIFSTLYACNRFNLFHIFNFSIVKVLSSNAGCSNRNDNQYIKHSNTSSIIVLQRKFWPWKWNNYRPKREKKQQKLLFVKYVFFFYRSQCWHKISTLEPSHTLHFGLK